MYSNVGVSLRIGRKRERTLLVSNRKIGRCCVEIYIGNTAATVKSSFVYGSYRLGYCNFGKRNTAVESVLADMNYSRRKLEYRSRIGFVGINSFQRSTVIENAFVQLGYAVAYSHAFKLGASAERVSAYIDRAVGKDERSEVTAVCKS